MRTMPKFFVDPGTLTGETVTLSGHHADHLKVLRLRQGEELTLCDGAGTEARCALDAVSGEIYRFRVLEVVPARGEPTVSVTVCAAWPKGDKAEHIVQKSVELGAAEIIFFLSERCVVRPDGKAIEKKIARLEKVAEAAAMQSYRGKIPTVSDGGDLVSALVRAGGADVCAFLWEEAREKSLRSVLRACPAFTSVSLITGPEGGFSRREAEAAETAGFIPVTLGERILRCETAPLAALTAVMFESGSLG